jgi:signal transduction histidine kinase
MTGGDKITEEQRHDFIVRIAANARSLSAVVQDLLDFSLLDREAVPLALTSVGLDQVVKGVIDRLAPMFTDHTIDFSASAADPVLAELNGLERIVTNLLTNAVKFSPPGSTVTVSVGPHEAGAEVVVSDQGPGIPPEERAKVFTRFYRGSGEVVVKTRGVGIGLSVVAELVERMSGRVAVVEAPGGGARFTVWLPRGTVSDDEEVHAGATTS